MVVSVDVHVLETFIRNSSRFPELFWYLIQICFSRSKADTPAIRKAIR